MKPQVLILELDVNKHKYCLPRGKVLPGFINEKKLYCVIYNETAFK